MMTLKNKSLLISVVIFILVNFIFNFQSWQEIFVKKTSYNTTVGDSTLAEFILENNYQLIKEGKNPFIVEGKLFYPFPSINLSLNDPGSSNVLFFFFLRPFFGIHESMLLVVMINIFLANLLMFLLLKKFNINNPINVIVSLSFGFLPVISYRILGHYTYTSIYLFPLVMMIVIKFFEEKNNKLKIFLSIFSGLLMMFILLLNFYYFIGIGLGVFFYLIYYLTLNIKQTVKILKKNSGYFFIMIVIFITSILPWLSAVYKLIQSNSLEKTRGFGGAIDLSGDLFGFITPSEYNPIYRFIILKLSSFHIIFSKFTNFYLKNTEKFIYSSLIVLISYFILIFFKKKLPLDLWKKIKPHFIISLVFAVLTLGPFLKVFNRWYLNLDGISVFFPLPFLLIHYVPGLSSVRAPTRFAPIYIFLALIVSAYILNYIYFRLKGKKKIFLIIGLLIIFFIDQFAILPKQPTIYFPLNIYQYLKSLPKHGTVLEIPFTVRDGFSYLGYVHGIGPMNGHLIHQKPIIGGYFARIHSSIFNYYKNLKFIGYILKIIDKGNYDPLKEMPKEPIVYPYPYPISTAKKELTTLNIKYIILKTDEKYSSYLQSLLVEIGYEKKLSKDNYLLFEN